MLPRASVGRELLGQTGTLGLEGGDHVGVGGRVERLGERPLALPEHAGQTAGPLDHPLGPAEGRRRGRTPARRTARRPSAPSRRRAAPSDAPEPGLGDPAARPGPGSPSACRWSSALSSDPATYRRTARSSSARPGVRAGGGGLALERTDLTLHLPDQVEQALEVLLGRGQAALGPLAPAAVLEDAGRLLDDRPAVLGAGLEDGVEVALADDHVLLAADAGVGEQLLDVEQPARRPVDRVLAVPGAEQRPGDGDLGQVGRQLAGAVVDGERHLGPTEGRPAGACP